MNNNNNLVYIDIHKVGEWVGCFSTIFYPILRVLGGGKLYLRYRMGKSSNPHSPPPFTDISTQLHLYLYLILYLTPPPITPTIWCSSLLPQNDTLKPLIYYSIVESQRIPPPLLLSCWWWRLRNIVWRIIQRGSGSESHIRQLVTKQNLRHWVGWSYPHYLQWMGGGGSVSIGYHPENLYQSYLL